MWNHPYILELHQERLEDKREREQLGNVPKNLRGRKVDYFLILSTVVQDCKIMVHAQCSASFRKGSVCFLAQATPT